MARRSEHGSANIGQMFLAATIIAAPLAAGGFRVWVLYILGALAAAAYGLTLYASHRASRPLHLNLFLGGLALLAAFTVLQAVSLPGGLLETLSPRAYEVRQFIDATGGSISYEVGATWRETAKLLLYMLIAVVAFERTRATKDMGIVCRPLVIAAITTSVIAILHRALGIERLFGLIDARGGSTAKMLTTFVNPNHAAGFMALAALTAIGLALDEERRPRRVGFVVLAGVFGMVSVLVLSKGGIVALVIGIALFAVMILLKRNTLHASGLVSKNPAFLVTALLLPCLGILWRYEAVLDDFGVSRGVAALGLEEKLAGMRDAIPLVEDHLWFGVGRGAYISVYSAYKTSALQLTFAFPENLAAQLASEWGVIVGGAAFIALITTIVVRLRRAGSWTAVGALVGVTAVVIQNAVDFSLEMPGVAIPVVAILAAAGARTAPIRRVRLVPITRLAVWTAGPIVLLLIALLMVRRHGDLFVDLATLSTPTQPTEAVLLERHPVNALIAARLAYQAETDDPPRYADAIRLANRAMYFAPTYADGHLLTGRLLVRAGHRRQGFGEFRRACTLAPASRRQWMEHVMDLARTPNEVIRAIPRRDEVMDTLDEREAARVATRLVDRGRPTWADAVLDRLGPVEGIDPEALTAVALAATRTGSTSYAHAALRHRLDGAADDEQARLALVRLMLRHQRYESAKSVIDGMRVHGKNADQVLRFKVRIAMAMKDYAAARKAVDELARHTVPTIAATAELSELRAKIEQGAGEPGRALEALDHGLDKDPANIRLRVLRATILLKRGRYAEARVDAEFVLRRDPTHVVAKGLVTRAKKQGSP